MDYLFVKWQELKERLKDKYTFLFLDYDGTLTPIVEKPEQAVIPKETKELLEKLAKSPRVKLVIISGRSLKNIKNKVRLKDIIYVGNHGLQIEGPKIKFESIIPPQYKSLLGKIKNDLERRSSIIKGAVLEDKGLSLSLHYRLVNKKEVPLLKSIFRKTIIDYLAKNKIKIKPGKKVLEIRPPLEWDKGKAVLWLLSRRRFASKRKSLLPIYIGDDKTDEDAFKALKDRGLTIFLGRPKRSLGKYYLKNTQEVVKFLRKILDLCRN